MTKENKRNILIVDDELPNIVALTHILEDEYEISAVKSGEDAVRAATTLEPDIILLDIIMPDMDGYAVIETLKREEKTKAIPVIFITGLRDVGDEIKGLNLGAADYITKPFSPAVVKLRVRNQIEIIDLKRELESVKRN